jgi:hypothetical protein
MNEKLNYYTSIHLPPQIPKTLQYHTSLQSTEITLDNLKKFNNNLDGNNLVTLAFLATNTNISEEDRQKYNKLLKEKATNEYEIYSKYINDNICRNQDSSTNLTECNN